MGKIIGICNQKGGVGKTTTAINLSTYVADKGFKTLLIDIDPQANATSGMGLDKKAQTKSVYHFLTGVAAAEEVVIKSVVDNLWIMPSSVSLAGAEIELVAVVGREFRLKQSVDVLKGQYDFIFIDCPPSLGLLTLNALVACDKVIMPLQCEYYSLEGISQLMETINLVKNALNPQLEISGIVLTMADFRTRLTADVINEVKNFFKEKVFNTIIPRNIKISEAPGFGQPLIQYDKFSQGAQKYEALSIEFLEREGKSIGGSRDKHPDEAGMTRPGTVSEGESVDPLIVAEQKSEEEQLQVIDVTNIDITAGHQEESKEGSSQEIQK